MSIRASRAPSPATKEWEAALRALIQRIQTGEKQALETFYDQTQSVVYGLVLRILRDPNLAEETTLDVYMQVYRQSQSYDPARGNPMSWLLNLSRSRAIDRLRSERSRSQHIDGRISADDAPRKGAEDEVASSFDLLALAQYRTHIRTALCALSPEQREVIEMAYFDGLSGSEIAEELRIPLGTVKSRLRMAIMNLRQSLGPLLQEVGL